MKKYILLSVLFCISLSACITPYEATGIDELGDILVVEGIITDDETVITLSRSVMLLSDANSGIIFVDNARVYVECEDGSQWEAEPPPGWDFGSSWRGGKYLIKNNHLDPDLKYRLKIEIEELEYCSDYSNPIVTPEIDSIFWTKRERGYPVMIHVATHSPDNKVLYYRWSYKEDWEIHSDVFLRNYPFYCWNYENSRDILIGSAEKTVFGRISDILTGISPSSEKLSVLYRITVKQNAISKRSYDYYANIKKNAQQIGSIFAPIPSELRGNIVCTSEPNRLVIGYVDVSSTTQKHRFISREEGIYEPFSMNCKPFTMEELLEMYDEFPLGYVLFEWWNPEQSPPMGVIFEYIHIRCVDCTFYGSTEQKPENWPDKK